MIKDIQPRHLYNAYTPIPPDAGSYVLYYEDHAVLLKRTEEGITFPTFRELERLNEELYEDYIYLFSVD